MKTPSERETSNSVEALDNDPDITTFISTLRQFDQDFCDLLFSKTDFTLRLEVRGNKGKLIHCRVCTDRFDRPQDSK